MIIAVPELFVRSAVGDRRPRRTRARDARVMRIVHAYDMCHTCLNYLAKQL